MSRSSSIRVLTLAAGMALIAGCATMMQGTTQQVSVSSAPTGADVSINGQAMGHTPVILDLSRKDNHSVRVVLDGYEPYEFALSRSTSGWVFGNVVFGGLIGLAVDAMSGGMYKLTPEQVHAELRNDRAAAGDDGLYLTVVLTPDPAWERIGTLQPLGR